MNNELLSYRQISYTKYLEAYSNDKEFMKLSDEEKLKKFKEESILNITQFNRDIVALKQFQKLFLKEIATNRTKKIKFSSIGCSTGQEPYSILMNNWEYRENLEIDAFDINPKNIEDAKKGEYLREVEILKESKINITKFFEEKNNKYVIIDELKNRISFNIHDISEKPLEKKYNYISMMHVMQYYNNEGTERIFSNLHQSLESGGYVIFESNPVLFKEVYVNRFNPKKMGLEKIIDKKIIFTDGIDYPQIYRKK